jgi:hypothetical protein
LTPPWVNAYVYAWAAAAWNYEGVISSTSYGTGAWDGVAYSQGHFKYAPPPRLYTLFNGQPWVRVHMRGNGTAWSEGAKS